MEQETQGLNFKGVKNLFNLQLTKSAILKAESEGIIPEAKRFPIGKSNRDQRIWNYDQVSLIGEKYGFLKKPKKPVTLTVFSTKGGILKSTLVLNIARSYALHNFKTIIIDLDPQADSTRNLGLDISEENVDTLEQADEMLSQVKGLYDYFQNKASLQEIILKTDLSKLDFIPSSSAIIPLMEIMNAEIRREYQFKEKIVEPLKNLGYDLIIFDNAPSWSIFATNSITASDILVSPLECKIAHYRNTPEFITYLNRFLEKMQLQTTVTKMFVPVKTSGTRKLSTQIKQHYHQNISNCSHSSIRESIIGEESVAMRKSVLEYDNKSTLTEDIREFLIELDSIVNKDKPTKHIQ